MNRSYDEIEVFFLKPVSNLVLEAFLVVYLYSSSYYESVLEKQSSFFYCRFVTVVVEKTEPLIGWIKIHMLRKSDLSKF
jgi:hypothetical protein